MASVRTSINHWVYITTEWNVEHSCVFIHVAIGITTRARNSTMDLKVYVQVTKQQGVVRIFVTHMVSKSQVLVWHH